jgi:tRNA nucleotidyltransferase (CCA-adding enzyme)
MSSTDLDKRDVDASLQSDRLYQQIAERVPDIWPVLKLIARAAEQRGWSLYLVGGAVRDLLLDMLGDTWPLTDIDLVVEGIQFGDQSEDAVAAIKAAEGAGVALAGAIQSEYTDAQVQVHGQFQTAMLSWQSWQIDIATARTESYPYPAANPEVRSSDIRQDLYRRDFTVNAIALKLTGANPGQLIDLFGGWPDLQRRTVRVLHENSFIEDPTRIFRAVRFAVRLGFTLETETERWIRTAVGSGVYARSRTQHKKVPALQSRLQAELKYLLEEAGWEKSLVQLDNLGALAACLDSHLTLTPDLLRQIRRLDRWLRKFDADPPRWLLLLELILAQLTSGSSEQVARQLNLSSQSQHRLRHIHTWEAHLEGRLAFSRTERVRQAMRPSQVYELLRSHSRAELLLMAARSPRTIGPFIWQYITCLADVPTLINGATLKRLGYPPGPQFKEILADIHGQQLDSKLATATSAEQYVLAAYPLLDL